MSMNPNRLGQILHEEEPDTRCSKCGTILIQVTIDPINGGIVPISKTKNMSDIILLLCEECSSFRIYNHEPEPRR